MSIMIHTQTILPSQSFAFFIDKDGVAYVRFSDTVRQQLADQFSYLGYISADEESHISYLHHQFAMCVGATGMEQLRRFSTGVEGEGIVVFQNLPFEPVNWSPLPGKPAHTVKATSLSEHIMLAMAPVFGEAYGIADEGYRLVNDLIPLKADLHRHTGNGSRATLGLHTENAALRFWQQGVDFSPKGLLLQGISKQQQNGPFTPVAIAARAIAKLQPEVVETLRQARFAVALPERQRSDVMPNTVGPIPVVLGPSGKEEAIAAFYGDMMRPLDQEAEAALSKLKQQLELVRVNLSIEPGMMVYLANGRVLHGRSDFEPVFNADGQAQRWLQRVFVTGRLDPFYQWQRKTDRVFDIQQVL